MSEPSVAARGAARGALALVCRVKRRPERAAVCISYSSTSVVLTVELTDELPGPDKLFVTLTQPSVV